MILYIDTTDFNKVMFAVADGEKISKHNYKIDPHQSFLTLSFLQKFLKSHKVKLSDIKKIIVNKGPGSFTGVRIGVVAAQALGFARGIPVHPVRGPLFLKKLEKF